MFFFVQFCKAIDRDLGDLIRDILELNKLATDYYSGDNDNNDTPEARTSRSSRKGIYPIEWSTFALVKETGDNALHYAARLGKCALVELLLDTGLFDVNDTTIGRHDQDDYDYDLTTADDNDNNNDNNSISDTNDTALTIACDLGWLSTIALLIERGAWLDHENGRSKTPLILATESIAPYDAHMCRMLLAAGADVNKVTRATANTCLLSACKFGDVALIGMLLASGGADVNWPYSDGATAIMRASYYNYPAVVRLLVAHGARVDARNKRQETALYIAAFRGHVDLVRLFVLDECSSGVDVNACDHEGDTPLSVACYENKPDVIALLLEQPHVSVNTHGVRGDTPLHIAVSNCSLSVVVRLLRRGARVDALNHDNETPLHIATRQENAQVVDALLAFATRHTLDTISSNGGGSGGATAFRSLVSPVLHICKMDMAASMIRHGCDVSKSFEKLSSPLGALVEQVSRKQLKFFRAIQKQHRQQPHLRTHRFFLRQRHPLLYQKKPLFAHYIRLVELVLASGSYRPTHEDYAKFVHSSLYRYMGATPTLLACRARLVELVRERGLCSPAPLVHLCRTRVRSLLVAVKPLHAAIDTLHIPQTLKAYLRLD